MKLGLLTAAFREQTLEEIMDFASETGLDCLEVSCSPPPGFFRRDVGPGHIDVLNLSEEKAKEIRERCEDKNIRISSLAWYANHLDPDPEHRAVCHAHLMKVMDASAMLGVNMVTTFIGRVDGKTVTENLKVLEEAWTPLLRHAEETGVRIAIENCPMWFTDEHWPGGKNIMTTPANWRKVFEILGSPCLGLNFDPSHFVWQQLDYIRPIYEFRDRIFHVHFKDTRILRERLADVGIMANQGEYMLAKVPGLGEIDWPAFISALADIGFKGCGVIELEDRAFEDSPESVRKGIRLGTRYLRNFII